MLELVEREALKWAEECGMKGTISVIDPKEEYFGFSVHLNDSDGRYAYVRFNKKVERQMWEMGQA